MCRHLERLAGLDELEGGAGEEAGVDPRRHAARPHRQEPLLLQLLPAHQEVQVGGGDVALLEVHVPQLLLPALTGRRAVQLERGVTHGQQEGRRRGRGGDGRQAGGEKSRRGEKQEGRKAGGEKRQIKKRMLNEGKIMRRRGR